MHLSPRPRTRLATLVVAGAVPAAAVLMGASSPAHDVYSGPAPVNVVHTEPAADRTVVPTKVSAPLAPVLPASVTDGDVPRIAYRAYVAAEKTMARSAKACGIDWKLIAGIGRVESHHANSGATDRRGTLREPIYGPTLDGTLAGNQVITDTDGGRLDGDTAYDRAVGPMQFLPSTWQHYAADGNGDGRIDPQNVFDAALTTARYLCDEGLNLRTAADRTTAVLRYNNSMQYVDDVLGFARSY